MMKKITLRKLEKRSQDLIYEIGSEADHRGIKAYLVGGFVRDLILNRKNLDLDIVLDSDTVVFAKRVAQKFQASVVVHERFKTASLIFPSGLRVDLATARKEVYPFPGSLPIVSPGTIQDDLFRRDFTINAMAVQINHREFGELIDSFGGYDDLKEKTIRILHKKSFEDDPTRLLRAIRFEQRFDFKMEATTLKLLEFGFRRRFDKKVKPQRYFAEFKKILKESCPEKGLFRLNQLKGLSFISPSLRIDSSQKNWINQVQMHIRWFEKNIPNKVLDAWFVYFIILVSPLSSSHFVNMGGDFNLTKEQRKDLKNLGTMLKKYLGFLASPLKPSRIYRLLSPLSYELILSLRVIASKKSIIKKIDKFLTTDRLVKLSATGEDLKKMGFSSNQKLGHILNLLLDYKLDGRIKSSEDELRLAQQLKERT